MEIPTAKDFARSKATYENSPLHYLRVHEVMIEFAKLHVKAALESVVKNVEEHGHYYNEELYRVKNITDKQILNSYPLTNIK